MKDEKQPCIVRHSFAGEFEKIDFWFYNYTCLTLVPFLGPKQKRPAVFFLFRIQANCRGTSSPETALEYLIPSHVEVAGNLDRLPQHLKISHPERWVVAVAKTRSFHGDDLEAVHSCRLH